MHEGTGHFARTLMLLAAIIAAGCRKVDIPVSNVPLTFRVSAGEIMTKAITNRAIGTGYDTEEQFVVYAVYSKEEFPANGAGESGYQSFWTDGKTCAYIPAYNAWMPATQSGLTWTPSDIFWPAAGYLTFMAYSPSGAETQMTSLTQRWVADNSDPLNPLPAGLTFNAFTVPNVGDQFDLLYTDIIQNRRRSDYTVSDGDAYDDDLDDDEAGQPIYNGIDIPFKHALCQVEVQAVNGLGSTSPTKVYIQKAVLKNVYNKGTFAGGSWTVDPSSSKTDYEVLDKGEDAWDEIPGGDMPAVSINPSRVLMLLPQDNLDKTANPDDALDPVNDVFLQVKYKVNDGAAAVIELPLRQGENNSWEPGKKYVYKLIFSDYIEFQATIERWNDEIITRNYTIIQ